MVAQKAAGRFVKGQSGNPNGRPKKLPQRHRLPASNRMTVFEVAEMPVTVNDRSSGSSEEMTLYRANLMAMGKRGAAGHAPSQKAFMAQVDKAAASYGDSHALTQFLFRETARLETLVAQYEARAQRSGSGVLVLDQEEWDRRTAELNRQWDQRKVIGFT